MLTKLSLSVVTFCLSIQAYGMEVKKFDFEDKFPKGLDLNSYKSPKKLSRLSAMKWYKLNRKWSECAKAGEKLTGEKSLGVWISYLHLSCLRDWYGTTRGLKVTRALDSFKKLERNKDLLLSSPYPGHRDLLLKVFLELSDLAAEKARNEFDAFINRNGDLVDHMDKDQRAEYYRLMGEIAWLRQKNEIAKANFLRSYIFSPDPKVLQRIRTLKAERFLKLDKYSTSFIESEDESQLWQRFSKAVSKGQTYKVASYGQELLNSYPGSKRIQEVRDEINTFYKRLLYRRGRKYESSKNDFEKQLMKAPPEHILHWATEAYERGYQKSSFRLAEAAAEKWENTPHAASALIIAGRSAFYLAKRKQARSYFETLIEKYSGHEASDEARYFLGLLHYRNKAYKKVIRLYDEFLLSEGSDKWELQVRYWLWRSLKKIGSKRTAEIAETIFKDFPLTYYGLVVRMEEKKGLQNIVNGEVKKIDISYWWPAKSQNRWQRVKKLIEFGWIDEAETEIDFMPDPQMADGHVIRARLWQMAGLTNRAIQDYAAAIDINHDYLSRSLMKMAFPIDHEKYVKKAEKEFSISRNLIWSIIRQESAFMPRAVSPSNAYGLMQMLSPTAKETARWLRHKNFKMPDDIFRPEVSIRFGTHFLSRMVGKYKGVIPLAVASYNVGPGNLDRWLSHRSDLDDWHKIGESPDDDMWMDELPWAETSFYVKAVMRNYLLYKLIHEKYDVLASPPWSEVKPEKKAGKGA